VISFAWEWPIPEAVPDVSDHDANFARERAGSRRRIDAFVRPVLDRHFPARTLAVLDVGCGGGEAVERLVELGHDAWGVDPSGLRQVEWASSAIRDRLLGGDGLALPFADRSFDVVVASGCLEHVGVIETTNPYSVRPTDDQADRRRRFLEEILRVLSPGGLLLIDFPNGAFPIDFWHGDSPGGVRWHGPSERFLPTYREVAQHVEAIGGASIATVSATRRLAFDQVGAHWYGRLGRLPMKAWLTLMDVAGLRWLRESALAPYLCLVIRRQSGADSRIPARSSLSTTDLPPPRRSAPSDQ